MKPASALTDLDVVENYRKKLALNHEPLRSISLGAGSKLKNKKVTIGTTSQCSSIRPGYGKLLNKLVACYQPDTVIELGTALGISTTYLATGNKNVLVITVEANSQLCDLARNHFTLNELNNITLINKPFDDVLPELTAKIRGNLLVFIDGNHTYDGTMHYYRFFNEQNNRAILVFDDIYWSAGMHKAWNEIQKLPESGLTIDLFQMGIVFCGKKKRNIALWY